MNMIKTFASPHEMLQWQYRSILEELNELQRHAQDPSCPCLQSDTGEFCLHKHSLGLHTLAKETASMDKANAAMLEDLAEEALDQHNALKDRITCGKEHKDEKDTVEWSRQWRKKLEPIYYACSPKKAHLHQDTIQLSREEAAKLSISGKCADHLPCAMLAKPSPCKVLKTHDDGDQTLKCGKDLFVKTTDGKMFKEVLPKVELSESKDLVAVARHKTDYGRRSIYFVEYEYNNERLITGTVINKTPEGPVKSQAWYFGKGTEGLKEANKIALLSDEEFTKAENDKTYSWEKTKKSLSATANLHSEGKHLENKEANETGFTLCLMGNKLISGCRSEGTPEHISADVCCPSGAKVIGHFHTHTNDVLEPSLADISEAKRLKWKYLCIGDTKGRVRCRTMSKP